MLRCLPFFYPCLSVFIRGCVLSSFRMIGQDKFAGIAALRPVRGREARRTFAPSATGESDDLADLLGGQINRNHYGAHLLLRQWYATPEACSIDARSLSLLLPQSLAPADQATDEAADPDKWLFLDTETTGLAGGTGTYAFLVGIAWWDAGGLQIEQFFMRDLDEEHSLLLELAERMRERPVLVTFNGKSFDWPLLETRYRMTRCISAHPPPVHLDLLHPARQLWRLRLGSVRLRDLEQHVLCGAGRPLEWSRHDDIDSSLIPEMYFDYLRGGATEPLAGIFRHNQMDLRGLATLAGRILALLDRAHGCREGAVIDMREAEVRDPVETFGLSRILRRRGHSGRARELYENALSSGLPLHVERLAQRELAQLAKRERDYTRATCLWEELRQASPSAKRRKPFATQEDTQQALEAAMEAAEQLAIYHEHRTKQPLRAAELSAQALAELRNARYDGAIPATRATKIEARLVCRLSRLQRRGLAKN
jgi:uncharacterized protein